MTKTYSFAASVLAAASLSLAEPPKAPAPPAYTSIRWDESYSPLKDPAKRTDPWDALKYIPFGDDSYLSLGGQARYRYEYWNNFTFGAGPQDDDGFHLTRFLLHADLHLGENLRFFVEGKSAMIDGRTGGPRSGDTDEVDLQQAFVDVILPFADKTSLTLRGGRYQMHYGAQRVIGPSDWTNAMRTFEGGKISLAVPNDTLDVFWVRPVIVENEEPNDGDGNTSFAGMYNTLSLPKVFSGAKLESYGLLLSKAPETGADADIYTIGSRFSGKQGHWDFDTEGMWQFGQFGSESIGAFAFSVEGGYTFGDIPLTPRAFVGFDIASGSPDPEHRDNQLFQTGHSVLGYVDVIGGQNIIDLHPGLIFKLPRGFSLRAEEHLFWRQNVDDAVYNSSGNLLRADTGTDAAYIGNEVDLLLSWQVDRHLYAYLGYSHFFAGDFIEETGADEDIDFVYAVLAYTF
jgi:hypothetical protein